MKRLLCSTAIAGALVFCAANGANASVLITSEVFSGSGDAPIYSTIAPDAFTPLFTQSTTGSVSGVQRSPYETNAIGANTAYSVLSPGGQAFPGSSATYNLGGASSFTILWGSPDNYNLIDFYSGAGGAGSNIGSFTGANLTCYNTLCNQILWDLVTFTSNSGGIGSVVLRDTGQAAFEYGLAAQTPLPAAAWLFGTVVAGAAGAARLRRRRKAA